jgi:DNA processing protein
MLVVNKLKRDSADFPQSLFNIAGPPRKLFVAGSLAPLASPGVAIVGSRKVSGYGRQITEKLAGSLAASGITIISGLALGVDSIAHQACLDASGKTIAVLPTPLTQIYPARHRQLANNIIETGGALVSEYTETSFINKINFVARNRIVSALADAVLVTEAALKSGSLHTARFALEQGKDVLAVPGNITSATSEGANNLIKRGAIPVTGASDVLAALGFKPKRTSSASKPAGANASEQLVLDLIASGASDGLELQAGSALEPALFNQTLTMLELTGKIRPLGANQWALS